METKKRTGRAKRLDTIREERRRQKRRQQLATILSIGGVVVLAIVLIIYLTVSKANSSNKKTPLATIALITPNPRPMANGLTMGNQNATVKVDVWEDFQCPMCAQYTKNVENRLIDTYIAQGKVYYVFHQNPFIDNNVGGKESKQSANASMCANEQGRFWDYHDILFTNQGVEGKGSFNDDRLIAFAQTLGLDMSAFNSCFKANRYQDQINKDLQAGITAGVNGTPSIFVNNVAVTPGYVPTYEQMSQAIDKALANK